MKVCSVCHRLYEGDAGFCPSDGQRLAPIAQVAVPRDPDDPRIGSFVCHGRYQIWRKVADGGMGRVYQGYDTIESRSVALKILHSDVALDSVSVQRFKREFEVSATLAHTHIVDVLAFEKTEDETYALVMEYLEGEELRMLLKRDKTIPPERVIRMLSQVALGLASAHESKVVHRDLKPDNIFLCGTHEGDVVKILDFGSVRDNSENAKKLTVMGTTIGSPFYMAPEQAQGLPSLDHRADVWSLAAIAYESLTGTVPFRGATGPAILLAILTQEPIPPSEVTVHQRMPVTLDPVMEHALTKDPDIRIKTIGDLADGIGHAFGLEGSHREWAVTPEEQLGRRIQSGLPALLSAHHARQQAAVAPLPVTPLDLSPLDQAMTAGRPPPLTAFDEDVLMGVPDRTPKWIIPAVAGAFVLVGAIVAFFALS